MASRSGAAQPAEIGPAPTQKELRRDIFSLVWPVTVESVLQMSVGLVNTAMVGHLSALAISAVGLCSRATMVGWALFQAVSTGVTVLVAQLIGSGDRMQARTAAVQGLLFGCLSAVTLAALFATWSTQILGVFMPEPDLLRAAVGYLRIVVLGMPAQVIMMAAGAGMRGSGNTRTPMLVAVFVNIINVIGSYGLIYGNLGLPTLGLRGAAISTVTAQWTGAIVALLALTSRDSSLGMTWRGPWHISRPVLGRMLRIGLPSTGESLFWQSAQIILTLFITGFGTKALAAHQLGMQAESLSYMPTAGFAIAATTLVGQAAGAGKPDLGKRATRELGLIAIIVTAFTGGLLLLLPRQIMSLLTNDAEVIALGAIYLRLMAAVQVPQQLSGVLSGSLRGRGDTRTPMIVAMAGLWGVRIPLAYVFAFRLGMGITGVWVGMTVDLLVRFALTAIRYRASEARAAYVQPATQGAR